jgi:hypothetical protein
MAGLATVAVGRRRTGKTTMTKKLLSRKPLRMPVVVYDVNKEYQDVYTDELKDFDVFLSEVVELRHTYIIIEEATIFFRSHSSFEQMINLLVRARHTGNIIQLNFHSFRSIPKNIYELLDYLIIFKTNDNAKDVKEKFDNKKVLEAYERVRVSKNEFANEIVHLY